MLRITLIALLLNVLGTALAQTPPPIEWSRCFGGGGDDLGVAIEETSDGGYIAAGQCFFNGGDVTGNHGQNDVWVTKHANDGTLQWQKAFGGSGNDLATCVHQTGDGGYIVGATSNSNDGDVTGNHGNFDVWVLKLFPNGIIDWQVSYGGSAADVAYDILLTGNGTYIVAGETNSNNGDVTLNHGYNDVWVLELSSIGSLIWQKTYGGSDGEWATALTQATDGGYVVAGPSGSSDGDATTFHGGQYDYWVIKIDATGNLIWQRSFGGSDFDLPHDVICTATGDIVAVGISASSDGDVTDNHGGVDYWCVGLNSDGEIQWQRSLGGSGNDYAESVIETLSGDLVVAGGTASNDGEVSSNHGGLSDAWVVRMGQQGAIRWEHCYGGIGADEAFALVPTQDGGFAIAGSSDSPDGDVGGTHGGDDVWILKLALDPTALNEFGNATPFITLWPNPAYDHIMIGFGQDAAPTSQLMLADQLGRRIGSWDLHVNAAAMERSLSLSRLPAGRYTLQLITNSGSTTRCFIKE